MSQGIQFTEADEGKRVVNATGETVGRIVEVRAGTAYVDPDPDTLDTIKSKLGWADVDDDNYPLREGDVEAVTDDEIRLQGF